MAEKTAHRVWKICVTVGLTAATLVLVLGWDTVGPIYDSIVAMDGYSVRGRNLLLIAYLLGMIAASGLAFGAGVLLSLFAARSHLTADQMQMVIYGDALAALRDGEPVDGAQPIKAHVAYIPVPVGSLSRNYGRSIRLDAAGLEALRRRLDSSAAGDRPSAGRT